VLFWNRCFSAGKKIANNGKFLAKAKALVPRS